MTVNCGKPDVPRIDEAYWIRFPIGCLWIIPMSASNRLSHLISCKAAAIDWYSASADECHISLSSKKLVSLQVKLQTQNDIWVFGHDAQSKSQKTRIRKSLTAFNITPYLRQPFKYLSMLTTVSQWAPIGLWMTGRVVLIV